MWHKNIIPPIFSNTQEVSVCPWASNLSHFFVCNMNGTPTSFGKFVALALVCYLGFILLRAHSKLQERKIGTVFQTMSEKTVQEICDLHFFNQLALYTVINFILYSLKYEI